MTASRAPEPQPAYDAPTVRLRLVGTLPTEPARPQKSLARRVARKILGPNLLTKRD